MKRAPFANLSHKSSRHLSGILRSCRQIVHPPPKRHAGEWADAKRILSDPPEPGRWRSSRIPYFIPIFEAASELNTREITVCCGAQMGKTEALLCIFGHRFDDGPRVQALIVQPNQDLARSFADDRLTKLLRTTPSLERLTEWGKRNRQQEKFISGLRCGVAWAGSPVQLSSHSVGLALADERDRMVGDVGGEGDPITLLRARTKNFARSLLIITSTPTEEDNSPIQAHFDDGSREMWEWCCPHCAEWFRPMSEFLHWQEGATPAEAETFGGLYCPKCGVQIEDRHKPTLNRTGRFTQYYRDDDGLYHPDPDPPALGKARSFWISGLCSPWVKFGEICRELVAAYRSGDPARIMAVLNTYCGEVFRTRGDAPKWQEVMALSRDYAPEYVPPGCIRATMGVDVQRDGIYYVVRGWGPNMSSWLLRHGFIAGATAFDGPWLTLSRVLTAPIRTLKIDRAFCDMGYKPEALDGYRRPDHQVYKWCRQHFGHAFPVQGKSKQDQPVKANDIDITLAGVTFKNGLKLWKVDTDYLKTWLHSRIRWPADADSGHWLLHRDITEAYCKQIAAEEVVVKASGQRYWTPRGRANHYFDAEVYALGAAMSAQFESLAPPVPADSSKPPAPSKRRSPEKFARRRL